MKSTILNIKKRVLVVETESGNYAHDVITKDDGSLERVKLICSGSGLSEEIAKELVKTGYYKNTFFNYNSPMSNYNHFDSALDSFISAIESNGYYWKDNPEKNKAHITSVQGSKDAHEHFMEAESKTFNPEQVILFEIL